jgi:serine/threonine-protein kinase PpkA
MEDTKMTKRHFISTLLLSWLLAPGFTAAAEFNIGDSFNDALKSGGTGPEMIVIPDGQFVLGGGRPGPQDLGKVKIDYLLAVGATEVTVAQYRQFLKASLSGNLRKFPKGGDELPVARISWDEAEAYVIWLSRESGHSYRLPSAAEWEYAARANTSTLYSWGDSIGENRASCMNCKSKFSGTLAPVGSFPANAWGLYDMHGNVWEWTKDCIDSNMAPPPNGMPILFGNCDLRELRGGSSNSDAWSIRAGARASGLRQAQNNDVGFRVVMDIPN